MTKTELIRKLSDVTGLSLKDVRAVLEAMTQTGPGKGLIVTSLKKGERVTISGFGTFYARERGARSARNPKTGGKVKVPKRRYPAFKPAKTLKEALKK
jgi:DNA-binding protein HU-beta